MLSRCRLLRAIASLYFLSDVSSLGRWQGGR